MFAEWRPSLPQRQTVRSLAAGRNFFRPGAYMIGVSCGFDLTALAA